VIDQVFVIVTFLGSAIGWFVLADSDLTEDAPPMRWFFRIGGGVQLALPLAGLFLLAMSTCGDADLPWWLYYGVGCWLP